jgi:hypothetical protein
MLPSCCLQVAEEDLQRVASATGAQVQTTVNNLSPKALGTCAVFEERQVGAERYNMVTGGAVQLLPDFMLCLPGLGGTTEAVSWLEASCFAGSSNLWENLQATHINSSLTGRSQFNPT